MIKSSDLITEIRKVSKEHPNVVVPRGGCFYFKLDENEKEWEPSCIVGYGLSRLGFEFSSDLVEYNSEVIDTEEVLDSFNIEIESAEDLEWLSDVQSLQDKQYPWESAVTKVDSEDDDV